MGPLNHNRIFTDVADGDARFHVVRPRPDVHRASVYCVPRCPANARVAQGSERWVALPDEPRDSTVQRALPSTRPRLERGGASCPHGWAPT